MKITHTYLAIVLILLFNGCSSSSDDNGNSATTVVPVAPNNLTGIVASYTQINLSWVDNSNNESGFKIQRRIGFGTYSDVVSLGQDVVNFSYPGLTPNTTYTFRVYAFNAVGNSLYSNEITITTTPPSPLPTISTSIAISITETTATSGGNITDDGGSNVTERGVCWSTSVNPTIALTTKTTDGIGLGEFTSNITGLTANTLYYVRAYATNSFGTVYGNLISFTSLQNSTTFNIPGPDASDIDGNTYQSVTNCGITFTKQNLNVSKYSDGTPIPQVTDPTQWANLTTGAWCYYNNDPANGTTYGKLYNWYAVVGIHDNDPNTPNKILAPTGWHVPSDTEWSTLINCIDPNANGGNTVSNFAGGAMKSTGTTLWAAPNISATNSSGFTGLPGGCRINNGEFYFLHGTGYWWSPLEHSIIASNAWNRYLDSSSFTAMRNDYNKLNGFSVRCVKD